jgi:hypothetical protein
MNKAEQMEVLRKQHEYDLLDRRLGEQRIIDEICEKKITPLEKRVSILEIFGATLTGGFTVGVAWLKKEGII